MKAATTLCALALLLSTQAQAAEPYRLVASYDGTLLVKVLDIELEQAVTPQGFTAGARMKSFGVLSLFKRLDVRATSRGRLDDAEPTPGRFSHVNLDRVFNREVEVRWNATDVSTSALPAYPSLGSPAPTKAQKLAATDPLTHMVRLALQQGDRPCAGKTTLFDGRQLYAVDLSNPQPREPTTREKALGLATPVRCKLVFTEVAGFDAKPATKKNQGLAAPLAIDFARVGANGPWVLAQVRGKTPLGDATIEIRSLKSQTPPPFQALASNQ